MRSNDRTGEVAPRETRPALTAGRAVKLVVELTDRCNLRCGHCPSGRHGGRAELPLGLLERLVPQARANGIGHLSFTGGEPTLHSRFADIVGLTAGAGLDWSMVTNGWSLPKHLETLQRHRARLGMITFSLDGAREATHDALRGRGSYRRVLQAASACVLRGLPFSFNMTLTRHNRGEIEAAVALAKGLGALGLRFGHLMSDPNPASRDLEMGPEARKALDAELHALQAASDFPVGFTPGGWREALFPCAPLQDLELNLDWQGRLGLCCHLSGFQGADAATVADLHSMDLAEALAALAARRQAFKAQKRAHAADGDWRDDDHFPCWYCAKHVGAVDWIRAQPDHPWFAALTGAAEPHAPRAFVGAAQAVGTCLPESNG
ncbi:radical SAM protein [uncultured Thiohalocapsa sp.]|uniref:radical SAM protein n=1 Tax=uncultured Thiohalocapsa sp. TaxID=768990 RepID=UPI0025F31FB8|nr:radical SAM protein [uncultured Thiohalocapsa sp.]